MSRVCLQPGLPGGEWAYLRPLSGRDEATLDGVGSLAEAAALLDRLIVPGPGSSLGPGAAFRLPIGDVDRLLAQIYGTLFEDRVESVIQCDACGQGFELQFSLQELCDRVLRADRSGILGPEPSDAGFLYRLPEGVRFRLPTLLDHEAVTGHSPEQAREELLLRCVVEGAMTPAVGAAVEEAMARLWPVLRLDLDAVCAECGAPEAAHFDIASFLLKALGRERRWLHREVHLLASRYHWSPGDILELPREQRRTYVALIRAEESAHGEALFS
jgi:hypothetical protein